VRQSGVSPATGNSKYETGASEVAMSLHEYANVKGTE
jgi:hypothetical protein